MVSRRIIITAFISLQIVLIFFYIYTQSRIIKLTYRFQDSERALQELQKKKKDITHELLQAQESQKLKNYAVNDLQMKKIRLSDIKQVPTNS